MKNSKLAVKSLINSFGATAYIFLVSLIIRNGEKIFGSQDNEVLAPIVFLLLFIVSALVTGGLVLGQPIMLYLDGRKKEAVKLLFYTGAALLVILVIIALIMFLMK